MRDKESVLQNDDELRRFFVIKKFLWGERITMKYFEP